MSFGKLDRKTFVDLKRQFVHPSSEVSQPDQLVGRDVPLSLVQSAIEREGSNIFVWGRRGVGKTSLAHSAVAKFWDIAREGPAIACEKRSTPETLFQDIARRAIARNPKLFGNSSLKLKLEALGLSVEGQMGGFRPETKISSVNHASELLGSLFPMDFEKGKKDVIIIDEFDQLESQDTIDFLTSLAKQMSVDGLGVKLLFCGVASNLESLIGSHESVGRYISAVKLEPLSDDQIWSVIVNILLQFDLEMPRGQQIRVGQVACGYPTFAHLIVDEVLNVAFQERLSGRVISQAIFNEAMRRAAASAATHLQGAYEAATLKGTDRYVEVLWAIAHGPHIKDRQYKDIAKDYYSIMSQRIGREPIDKDQTLRNHVNALCKASNGSVVERLQTGWYRFRDPMFRAYVRMVAYSEGVELGDESFPR